MKEGLARYVTTMEASADEVFANMFVGNRAAAANVDYLRSVGIDHVVNTAEGDSIGSVTIDVENLERHGIR